MDDAIGILTVLCCVAFYVLMVVVAVVLAGVSLVLWGLLLASAWVYRAFGGKDWR